MKQLFIERKFKSSSIKIIGQANVIVREYQEMGFSLTLRQLYYQFVARGFLPNKQVNYKRLGSIINDARLAGLLDWAAIEDRTRNLEQWPAWNNPQHLLTDAASGYAENPWLEQSCYVEVWIEKEALIGVIEPICERLRVPYFACRGYTSQSEAYSAGKRLKAAQYSGKTPIILHLGDHDPSGLDMTRDNGERLAMFAGVDVEVQRLALNRDQIDQYNPPPNPAKETDSRFAEYEIEHGDESWELDALNPPVIEGLIQSALDNLIDTDAWEESMRAEEENRDLLEEVANNWPDVAAWLEDRRDI